VESTANISAFSRNLNVFKRDNRRFELKVVAVLHKAFGLSLRKTSSLFRVLTEHISESSIED